jgi:hypothetical protein
VDFFLITIRSDWCDIKLKEFVWKNEKILFYSVYFCLNNNKKQLIWYTKVKKILENSKGRGKIFAKQALATVSSKILLFSVTQCPIIFLFLFHLLSLSLSLLRLLNAHFTDTVGSSPSPLLRIWGIECVVWVEKWILRLELNWDLEDLKWVFKGLIGCSPLKL